MPRWVKIAFSLVILFSLAFFGLLLQLYYTTLIPKGNLARDIDLSNWEFYESNIDRFKVKLPSLPRHLKEEIELPNSLEALSYQVYLCESHLGSTFMISIMKYPPSQPLQGEPLLRAAIDELVASDSQNRLSFVKDALFYEMPALDFAIRNQTLIIRGRTFLADKNLYVLSLVEEEDLSTENLFQSFIETFHYLDEFYLSQPHGLEEEEVIEVDGEEM